MPAHRLIRRSAREEQLAAAGRIPRARLSPRPADRRRDGLVSIDDAASFCKEGLPHAIIVDSIQKGSRFTHFREEILEEVPDFVFIEILEQGSTFEMSGTNGAQMARIGRDVVASSLPAALMFELSRGL